jgi:ATP-dependent Clp protease protease subunit
MGSGGHSGTFPPGGAGEFPGPGEPGPGSPRTPQFPEFPRLPGAPLPSAPAPAPGPDPATWVRMDPMSGYQDQLFARLLEKRIIMATGVLDDDAATRICAQLLTLDAEGDDPIRLELQNLRSDLGPALAVMGVLDVVRVPVHAQAGGETSGAAVGVLAACPSRLAYPNASFTLAEPKLEFGGTVTAVTERQRQAERMLDSLYYRIAEATGRDADEIREDARRGRTFSTAEAIGYGLIQDRVSVRGD